MHTDNRIMLLRDSEIEPTDKVLENLLGNQLYPLYQEILNITANELDLEHEWRYYNDGKSWLFKAVNKKRTIFWLSVWEGFVKTSFFFTEKTRSGIFDLPVSDKLKEDFMKAGRTGKLIPLIIDIDRKEQLNDFRLAAGYKKNLK